MNTGGQVMLLQKHSAPENCRSGGTAQHNTIVCVSFCLSSPSLSQSVHFSLFALASCVPLLSSDVMCRVSLRRCSVVCSSPSLSPPPPLSQCKWGCVCLIDCCALATRSSYHIISYVSSLSLQCDEMRSQAEHERCAVRRRTQTMKVCARFLIE